MVDCWWSLIAFVDFGLDGMLIALVARSLQSTRLIRSQPRLMYTCAARFLSCPSGKLFPAISIGWTRSVYDDGISTFQPFVPSPTL